MFLFLWLVKDKKYIEELLEINNVKIIYNGNIN